MTRSSHRATRKRSSPLRARHAPRAAQVSSARCHAARARSRSGLLIRRRTSTDAHARFARFGARGRAGSRRHRGRTLPSLGAQRARRPLPGERRRVAIGPCARGRDLACRGHAPNLNLSKPPPRPRPETSPARAPRARRGRGRAVGWPSSLATAASNSIPLSPCPPPRLFNGYKGTLPEKCGLTDAAWLVARPSPRIRESRSHEQSVAVVSGAKRQGVARQCAPVSEYAHGELPGMLEPRLQR